MFDSRRSIDESNAMVSETSFPDDRSQSQPKEDELLRHEQLHEAMEQGNVQQIKALVEQHGTSLLNGHYNGCPPLLHASVMCTRHALDLVQYLLASGADVQGRHAHTLTTALHAACENASIATVMILLHSQADVNAQDNVGNTPLHVVLKSMKNSGGSPQGKHSGSSSKRNDATAIMKSLVQWGASVRMSNHQGKSARQLAFDTGVSAVFHEVLSCPPRKSRHVGREARHADPLVIATRVKSMPELKNPSTPTQAKNDEIKTTTSPPLSVFSFQNEEASTMHSSNSPPTLTPSELPFSSNEYNVLLGKAALSTISDQGIPAIDNPSLVAQANFDVDTIDCLAKRLTALEKAIDSRLNAIENTMARIQDQCEAFATRHELHVNREESSAHMNELWNRFNGWKEYASLSLQLLGQTIGSLQTWLHGDGVTDVHRTSPTSSPNHDPVPNEYQGPPDHLESHDRV